MRRKIVKSDLGRAAALIIAAAFLLLLGLLASAEAAVSIATPINALKDGASSSVGFNAGGYTDMIVELSYDGGESYEAPPIYEGPVASAPNPLLWTVPVSFVNSSDCMLKITCSTGASSDSSESGLFTIENTAPTFTSGPTVTPAGWTKGPIRIEFDATDPELEPSHPGSGIDHYEVNVQGVTDYGDQVSPFDLDTSSFASGTYTAHVIVTDVAGNETASDVSFQVDNTPPAAFSAVPDVSDWTRNDVNVSFLTSDPLPGSGVIDHYEVSVDGGPFGEQASPYKVTLEGTHTVTVRAFDGAQPQANFTDASCTTLIDRTVPELDQFACWADSGGTTVQIEYAASDALSGVKRVSLWYKKGAAGTWTDSGLSFTDATNTFFFETIGDDTYFFGFVIDDYAGNAAASNTGDGICSATIDTQLPQFGSIVATPAFAKAGTTVTITFSASEDLIDLPYLGVGNDDGTYVSSSGRDYTFTYTVSPEAEEGPADIYIEGVDLAYNYNWVDELTQLTIDNTPPEEFTPTANPAGWTTDSSIAVEFDATDTGSGIDYYEIAVDDGAYSLDVSPYNVDTSGLTNGIHTVHVKAVDLAGNERIEDAAIYIGEPSSDTTPPAEFQPTANPSTWTKANSASITFSTTDDESGIARYEVALDGGAYAEQTSPYVLNVSGVADGAHTVHVKAVDNAGNERTGDVTILLDKTAPQAFVPVSTPAIWKDIASAKITWVTTDSGSGVARYEVAIDNGAYSVQASPYTVNVAGLANGAHVVRVRAIDVAGNSMERSISVVKSTSVPTAALTFTDPKPALGRQFDYVFWKNWMGVRTAAQNTYNINWTASGIGKALAKVFIDYRPNASSAWTSLRWSSAPTGAIAFDVSTKPESDNYQFRIRAVDAAGGSRTVIYDRFGVYDATKLAPTVRVLSPKKGTTVRIGDSVAAKVQVIMPVFNDPRSAGNAYKDNALDWWFVGHTLTATPKLESYKKNSAGVPIKHVATLLASIPRTKSVWDRKTSGTESDKYLGHLLVDTWQTTHKVAKGTVDSTCVCQLEMQYADVVTVGKTRQPNTPSTQLPPKSVEPLVDMLKQYEYTRFYVK